MVKTFRYTPFVVTYAHEFCFAKFVRINQISASVLKRSTRADCKSAGLAFAGSNPARRTFVENTLRGVFVCKSAPGASKQFCLRLDSKDAAMSPDERVGVEST